MQKIKLVCMGKLDGFCKDALAEYSKRLLPLCKFEMIEIAPAKLDEKNAGSAQIAAALAQEGDKILAAVPPGWPLAALCVEGGQMQSEAFASFLADAAVGGSEGVAFAVGSSHGLAGAVKARATLRLSLSQMTLPHQLARVVLAEQIYRAYMILNNAKYHK